ncbi:MAG: haloacid dehalogenase [Desulfobacteraceae bacterium]|nr:MAG: haloacid dehalogenase [Desulfobacteraceae bacterium]
MKRKPEKSGKIPPYELAFDVDGVFADTFRTFVETAREHYGIQLEYEDITEYDFRQVIDIDEKTSHEIIQMILDNPLAMGIQPVFGAVDVLSRLSQTGPLLFVTARPERESILQWIQQYLPVPDMSVIRLEATSTHEEKLPVLLKHGIRYFVEDRLETCYLLEKTSITPIVFEQPWNRKPHPFQTVKDWHEIEALIQWNGKNS